MPMMTMWLHVTLSYVMALNNPHPHDVVHVHSSIEKRVWHKEIASCLETGEEWFKEGHPVFEYLP